MKACHHPFPSQQAVRRVGPHPLCAIRVSSPSHLVCGGASGRPVVLKAASGGAAQAARTLDYGGRYRISLRLRLFSYYSLKNEKTVLRAVIRARVWTKWRRGRLLCLPSWLPAVGRGNKAVSMGVGSYRECLFFQNFPFRFQFCTFRPTELPPVYLTLTTDLG